MGIGIGTDFKIYQEYVQSGYMDKITQNIAGVAGLGGAIRLSSRALKGNYDYQAFFDLLPAVARRDPDSTSSRTANNITQDDLIRPKCHRDREVSVTRNQWLRIGLTPEKFSLLYGASLADAVLLEQLNTGLGAVQAAMSNESGCMYDFSGTGTMTHAGLWGGLSKMGDAVGNIVGIVMHSKVFNNLVGQAIADKIYGVAEFAIRQGTTATFGRPVLVTDSSSLIVSGSSDHYITLGLTAGAIEIEETESQYTATMEELGLDNIVNRIQTEYAYNLGIRGNQYQTGTGGLNPTAATLATATSWSLKYSSIKNGPGVRIVST